MKVIILLLMIVCLSGCNAESEIVEQVFDAIEQALDENVPEVPNLNEDVVAPPDREVSNDDVEESVDKPQADVATDYYGRGEHLIETEGIYTIYYKADDLDSVSLVISDEETTSLILAPEFCYEAGEQSVERRCMTKVELAVGDKIDVTGGALVSRENPSTEGTYEGDVNQRVGYRAGEHIPPGVYYVLDETAYTNNEPTSNMVYTSMGDWIINMYELDVYSDYTFEKIYPNERFYLHEDMYIALDGPVRLIYLGEFNY